MANRSTLVHEPLPPQPSRPRRFLWQGQVGPAFWTVASILSLIVNVILIAIILTLLTQIFAIKKLVGDELVGGLYENFVKMDQAHIRTTIQVNDTIQVKDQIQVKDTIVVEDTMPVVFTLPLNQETTVILTRDTPVNDATVYLNGSPVTTDLVLRQGTKLNIRLNMDVPVNQTIPVKLNVPVDLHVPVNLTVPVALTVPVDIPLAETELHEPFVGLQNVVAPYHKMLQDLPGSWSDIFCGPLPKSFCD
jgi:hypothetical protein